MKADGIRLSDKPVLGPAAMQPQPMPAASARSSTRVFQPDAALKADLGGPRATNRSLSCESIATSAATEALLADTDRTCNSILTATAEADRAGPARASSPPFCFEEDAGEDSLVDLGDISSAHTASVTALPELANSKTDAVLQVSRPWQSVARAQHHHQPLHAMSAEASSQEASTQDQLGLLESVAAKVASQSVRRGPLIGLQKREHAGPVGQEAASVSATASQSAVPRMSTEALHVQQAAAPVTIAAASAPQLMKAGLGQQESSIAAVSGGSNEIEEVGMARAVRRAGPASAQKDTQTVAKPPKPASSSKVAKSTVLCVFVVICASNCLTAWYCI